MADCALVVVGASTGGVQALQTLIAGLPANFPAAVLVVLHIPAHTPSHLHTILARVASMPVTPAEGDGDISSVPVIVNQKKSRTRASLISASDRHSRLSKARSRSVVPHRSRTARAAAK
jgi:chemotaxis response regulator CheB